MRQVLYDMRLVVDSREHESAQDIETFVLAAGSDYRAYEVLRKLQSRGICIRNLILFEFTERLEQIELGDSYGDYSRFVADKIVKIGCSIRNPKSSLGDLLSNQSAFIDRTVSLDISCFTKPFFFYLLKLFKERFRLQRIDVFYTEPLSYLFPRGIFSSYHSTLGPLTILEIPGFSGLEQRGEKRILVILLGFDGDLARGINEDVSPSEVVAVNGFPGYAPKFKDISLIANEKLTSDRDVVVVYSRANNPFEVFNLLEKISIQSSGAFINIAPLGTKPMALGACLFALHNPSSRVVYPFPESYLRVTTDRCWNSWKYEIPLVLDVSNGNNGP